MALPLLEEAMKFDGALSMSLSRSIADWDRFESLGLDGAWSFEGSHDPFIPLTLATQSTKRIMLGTGIAVAFARTPMTAAHSAWDLQRLSKGRFVLGLGSQIKPHIEKRYSMPWSSPAARMREYVAALRAIWHTWQTGERLNFRGDFYTHTLMTPVFSPSPLELDPPPIYVAGVGPLMMRTIGAVADGYLVHPFHTPAHLAAETLPALAAGAAEVGRDPQNIEISCQTIIAMGTDEQELAKARLKAKQQIAFYSSTPAYKGVLRHHGYEGLQGELNIMSKQDRWREMAELIDDTLFDLIVVSGTPAEVGRALIDRNQFANRVTLSFYGPKPTDESIAEVLAAART